MARFDAEVDKSDRPGIRVNEKGGTKEYHHEYNRKYYLSRRSELLEKANARYKKSATRLQSDNGAKENILLIF